MLDSKAIASAVNQRLYGSCWASRLSELGSKELYGRSHYLDTGTLHYFKSRVLHLEPFADGLMLGCIESSRPDNECRYYRAVIFDLLGTATRLSEMAGGEPYRGWKTSKPAYRELREFIENFDAEREARRVVAEYRRRLKYAAQNVKDTLKA